MAGKFYQATLEKTLVGRKEVVDRVEQELLEKILIGQTYQSLLIAPRGSGKTHITKLLHYRLKNNPDLDDKIFVAYMNEDERGIANYSDFIRHILQSFVKHQEGNHEVLMDLIYEVSGLPIKQQETAFENILLEFIGKKGLVILVENLNILFDKKTGMGLDGQNKLRSLMHEHNQISILATSQNLFYQIQDAKAPFYNFFNIDHLEKLNFEQAFDLVKIQADLENNDELTQELTNPIFKGKVRAIYTLTGGNHRLLVIFFNFLKVDFKSNLSEVFVKTMNDLKPYYEQFINALSPQQQKIIQFLSSNHTPKMGKEISRFCFIAPNTLSKQTAELVEKGLLGKNKKGKDIYYELREPLMRICFEINETTGGIAKLFIDFLTVLYSEEDLQKRYLTYKFGALLQKENSKIIYEKEARFYKKSLAQDIVKKLDCLEMPRISTLDELNKNIDSILEKSSANNNIQEPIQTYKLNRKKLVRMIKNSFIYSESEKAQLLQELPTKSTREMQNLTNQFLEEKEVFANNFLGKELYSRFLEEDGENKKELLFDFNFLMHLSREEKLTKNTFIFNRLGELLNSQGNFLEAIENFNKAINLDPYHAVAYYNRGNSYVEIQDYEKAILSYKKAISIRPNYAIAYNNLGNVYSELNRHNLAIDSFKKSIKIAPQHIEIYFNLGKTFFDLKDYKNAIMNFDKSIELNPNISYPYIDKGISLGLIGKYEEALLTFKKAIEINPKSSILNYNIAITYGKLLKFDKAIEFCKKALLDDPTNEDIYFSLGYFYNEKGIKKLAIESYSKVLRLVPSHFGAFINKSYTLLEDNRYKEVIKLINNAIDYYPDNPKVINVLGIANIFEENFEIAQQIFSKGLERNNDDWFLNSGITQVSLIDNRVKESISYFTRTFDLFETEKHSFIDFLVTDNLRPLIKYSNFHTLKKYLNFLINFLDEKQFLSKLWKAFPKAIFNLLINIEDYSENRLSQLNTYLQEIFKSHKEMVIPLLYLDIGIRYLKKGEKRAIYDLSKEERQIFKEFVLDKRVGNFK